MNNQLLTLLKAWNQAKDECDWVLGTVYKTEGSSYRKAGAMTLINSLGQQYGLLSGGCLESDIVLNARRVMSSQKTLLLEYDGNDEDDWSYQLGIGCGGKVYIMLQPINGENAYALDSLYQALLSRQSGLFCQKIGEAIAVFEARSLASYQKSQLKTRQDQQWLEIPIAPEPHLLLIGGGIDARPVVSLAAEMGWLVSILDPRPANARKEHFLKAHQILRSLDESLPSIIEQQKIDAVVLMTHNIEMDAAALKLCNQSELKYLALLGPVHRYQRVLKNSDLRESELKCPVSAPAGLDLGGELPESVALSILSECHANLFTPKAAALNLIAGL